jgi:hypothetical protein
MNDFKFWRDTRENRGRERKKKLTNTKLELKTPRAPPGREWVVETYLTTPKKLVVNGGGVLDVRLLCTH